MRGLLARDALAHSSSPLLALENSPDFNRACTPAIASSWATISAWSCSLFIMVRTYDVRLPEGGAAVSSACARALVRCPPQARSSLNCKVRYVIGEIAKDNDVGYASMRWLGMGLAVRCVGMGWCSMVVASGGLRVIRAIVVGVYHPGAAVVSMIGCITTTAGIASTTTIGEAMPSPAVTISPA